MNVHSIDSNNLEDYYKKLFKYHAQHEPIEVKAFHNDIIRCANECETIGELGVFQGCTLAAILMTKPKQVYATDITLKTINPWIKLFQEYAKDNKINLTFNEMSSTDSRCVKQVDMLHIDSFHNPNHLRQELKMHENSVKKYIVFHDTKSRNASLQSVIVEMINSKIAWAIDTHYTKGNAGHTVIKRIGF